jgi:hypothetical protein
MSTRESYSAGRTGCQQHAGPHRLHRLCHQRDGVAQAARQAELQNCGMRVNIWPLIIYVTIVTLWTAVTCFNIVQRTLPSCQGRRYAVQSSNTGDGLPDSPIS